MGALSDMWEEYWTRRGDDPHDDYFPDPPLTREELDEMEAQEHLDEEFERGRYG